MPFMNQHSFRYPGWWLAVALAALGCGTSDDTVVDTYHPPDAADADADAADADADVPVEVEVEAGADADADIGPDADADPDDAGEAEADVPPACPCPTLPTTCTAPAADVPTFTPPNEAMLDQLFGLLACADSSVRLAIYETDWDCVVDALLAKLAADTDIVFELVIDDDRCPREGGGALTCPLSRLETSARVSIALDNRSGLMHHKFALFDDARLWVGSANLTQWSFCTDSNNAIVVNEPAIVAAYGTVFRRMFVDGTFGPVAPEEPVADGAYKVYFSPESPSTSPSRWFNDLVAAIGTAATSAEAMINAFTRTEVSDALIAAHGRGVTVRAVVQNMYIDDAPAQALLAAGIPLHTGEMHSKVLVLDGQTVITGSANWSANAWSNNENSLWITDTTIAAAYHAEFERVWAATSPPAP
ncbi:MAG: hypothetical protein JXB32_04120 [Deltaproteobacteria bacterium]|nr:hypothetical protein [Deltaproteobacteria bacterium]